MTAPRDAHTPQDSERALRVFRDAVGQHRGDAARIEDLRAPLRQFCVDARREQVPPEQVLIQVKHALDGLSAVDDRLTDRQAARDRIIAFAIETYYSDRQRDGV